MEGWAYREENADTNRKWAGNQVFIFLYEIKCSFWHREGNSCTSDYVLLNSCSAPHPEAWPRPHSRPLLEGVGFPPAHMPTGLLGQSWVLGQNLVLMASHVRLG